MVIFIGIMLSVFQQAVGINAVLYFAPRIFESMGMGNPMVQTVFMGIVNILFTLLAVFTVEKWGRKPLLIYGSIGMAIGALGVALSNAVTGISLWYPSSASWSTVHRSCSAGVPSAGCSSPKYSPIPSVAQRSHRCRFPMDIQFHRLIYLPAHVQHECRRYGRQVWPHVCIRTLRSYLHHCSHLCMEISTGNKR